MEMYVRHLEFAIFILLEKNSFFFKSFKNYKVYEINTKFKVFLDRPESFKIKEVIVDV